MERRALGAHAARCRPVRFGLPPGRITQKPPYAAGSGAARFSGSQGTGGGKRPRKPHGASAGPAPEGGPLREPPGPPPVPAGGAGNRPLRPGVPSTSPTTPSDSISRRSGACLRWRRPPAAGSRTSAPQAVRTSTVPVGTVLVLTAVPRAAHLERPSVPLERPVRPGAPRQTGGPDRGVCRLEAGAAERLRHPADSEPAVHRPGGRRLGRASASRCPKRPRTRAPAGTGPAARRRPRGWGWRPPGAPRPVRPGTPGRRAAA